MAKYTYEEIEQIIEFTPANMKENKKDVIYCTIEARYPDGTHEYTALPRNRRAAIKEIFDGLKQGFILTIKDYKGE